MKKDKKKKVIITILIIVSIVTFFFVFNEVTKNKKVDINLKTENKRNSFAMYIQDGEDYKEYKEDKFPKGYKLNIEKSYCEDNKGDKITPIENVLSSNGLKVTVKSNKTIYCTLYFDKVEITDDFIYYIKEDSDIKYTNKETNNVYIKYEMEDITSYCLTEEETSENCEWKETNGSKEINTTYTFKDDTNEEKKVKVYLKDIYETISNVKEDKIILDTVVPEITSVRTIYDLWGSRSYTINSSASGYVKDYGVDGTWVTQGEDPFISIRNINITGITGVYLEFTKAIEKDMSIQIYYVVNGGYGSPNVVSARIYKGQTKILIEIPSGDWQGIRFDIGTEAGLSYQIKHLGVLATDGQANNDEILLELKGTVGISGLKEWDYTYTDGDNWIKCNGENNLTSYMTYSAERNQNTYIRLCNNAGVCSSSTSKPIKIDKTVPKITSVRTIYDLWGSRSYYYNYRENGYAKDYGVNGTWISNGIDPFIGFQSININGISGAYVELANPLNKDIRIDILYGSNNGSLDGSNYSILKAGETKLLIELPAGNYQDIRYDIGIEAGLSYKIVHLGVLATDGQANNDAIILETKGTVGVSGIKSWQNTYINGSNWVDTGEKETISYITYTGARNQNTYLRLCNNAGVCSSSVSKLIHITS